MTEAYRPDGHRENTGVWIEYGRHDNKNDMWVDPSKVSTVRNIGKNGSRGSILLMDCGREYLTGYPASQLVAMLRG